MSQMKLWLADTSIRQYRRRDGRVAFRLRSYLMIETTESFRLSAYLRSISGSLKLSTGTVIPLEQISYSEGCHYRCGVMVHDFRASAVAPLDVIRNDVGLLRLDYHISFTGHPAEEPDFIEMHVPVLPRGRGLVWPERATREARKRDARG